MAAVVAPAQASSSGRPEAEDSPLPPPGADTWGSNAPLLGGKHTVWEGGIRVPAFAVGGVLPASRRNAIVDGLAAGWDWCARPLRPSAFASRRMSPPHVPPPALPQRTRSSTVPTPTSVPGRYATFAALAGVDPTDESAATAGLPPIESYDLWPMITGREQKSPRSMVQIGGFTGWTARTEDATGELMNRLGPLNPDAVAPPTNGHGFGYTAPVPCSPP